MITVKHTFKLLIGTIAASLIMVSQAVTLSQSPLLTQAGAVLPNLMLIFDDSGSMKAQVLYQYGGTAGGYGQTGPGGTVSMATCPSSPSINVTCTYNPFVPSAPVTYPNYSTSQSYNNGDRVTSTVNSLIYECTRSKGCPATSSNEPSVDPLNRWDLYTPTGSTIPYWEVSPDINRLYYDPRVRYRLRMTSDAITTAPAPTVDPNIDFNVYLYQKAGVASVWGGTSGEPDPKLASSYFTTYTPAASLLDPSPSTVQGKSYPTCVGKLSVCGAGGSGPFPKFINRSDCNGGLAGGSCSLAEEQLNYAIWKKFHSNRLDLAKTGLGYAFQDITGTLRLGWSVFSDLGAGSSPVTDLGPSGSGVSLLDQTRKDAFYTWLYSRTAPSDTPTRESLVAVGTYFSRADNLGPWADTPDPTSKGLATLATTTSDTTAKRATHASCRRSYALVTTDGYYNDSPPSITPADADYTAIATITGTTPAGAALTFSYNGRTLPYAQASSYTTLADIAMKYWITDLRTDLPNNVPTSTSNESFWQNMGFYGVGLGIFGTLAQTPTTLASLTSGATSWPTPPSGGNNATTIDDLWHATINGRGRMLSAANADALSDGVEGMLAEINRIESSQSGVAASTLSLTTTTRKYTPNYTTGTWVGNVIASKLEPKSGAELCTQWRVTGSWLTDPTDSTKSHWYVGGKWDGTSDLPPCTGSPTIYNGIPDYSTRNIYSWNGSTYGNFDSSNSFVMTPSSGGVTLASTTLINYLRGDQTNEDITDSKGIVLTSKLYRSRPVVLGDIVNSTPTFIQGALNMNYNLLPANTYGQSTYAAFLAAKTARPEGVLFAGANDGMLHGFRDTTGAEVFAFVPRAAMPAMNQIASRSYNHRYYVDGTTIEADACLSNGSACTTWTNMLLGAGGAGAKTVYALDVTDPINMSASSVKWEITPTSISTSAGITNTTSYANLGNILSDVQTGLTTGGQWVAIFGNGYTGADGKAHLYIADLATGALVKDIAVGTAGSNGLGGVRLLRDANQRIITAYAGDLNGSLWKFDLSATSSSAWAVGISGNPLFQTATTPVKPITATPAVVAHPLNGYVVVFGTGKMFESGTTDISNTDVQSVYGVWDSVTPPAITQIDKTSLVQQTISNAISGTTSITNTNLSTSTVALNYYSISQNPINWTTTPSTPRGWYIDLPNTGQRVIYPIEVLVGKFASMDTVSPSNVSINPCLASGTGKAWNYVIDMVTGGGPANSIFTSNGGISTTTLVSGYENSADGRTRYIKNDALSTSTSTAFTPLSTQQLPSFQISCALTNTCSSTTTTVKRVWRQLFMR
jgi:type IV pilus assembly protein PilY1